MAVAALDYSEIHFNLLFKFRLILNFCFTSGSTSILVLLYKHQWNTKWAFSRKLHILTRAREDNMLSSHVKRSPSLWLHNKSRLRKQADWVFHWCLYNKQNITYSLMDMNFIFSCSTRYLTRSLRSLVRYRVDHSKIHIHARVCNILYLSRRSISILRTLNFISFLFDFSYQFFYYFICRFHLQLLDKNIRIFHNLAGLGHHT